MFPLVFPTAVPQETPLSNSRHGPWRDPETGSLAIYRRWKGMEIMIIKLTIERRFKVESEGYAIDSLVAWACIRLDRLQQGYRFLRLVDTKGFPTEGMLLVKVEKNFS
jgi:hypothetical protein